MPTNPLPIKDSERYLVHHPHELERILQGIMESKTPLTLYDQEGKEFILSSIVALVPKEGVLFIEQGSSQSSNQQLMASDQVTCVTTQGQVHIQFTVKGVQPAKLGDEEVFRIPIPQEILRLQRREYYRLGTSIINPVKCMINTVQGLIETIVVDISIGGIGILSYEGISLLKAGETYHGCRIEMPGAGTFAVSLNVCTIFDVALKNGRITHRAGCRFIDLPSSVETEVQRYINRLERQRLSRYI